MKDKYGKYFITETNPNPLHPWTRQKDSEFPWWNTLYISGELDGKIPGIPYMETNIVLRAAPKKGPEDGGRPHYHNFNEYLLFHGLDPDDPFDLGGEVEFWVEDEPHIITKTCALYIPAGVYHCPFFINKVDRPFIFITTGNTPKYAHMHFSDDPKYKDFRYLDEIAEIELGGKKYQITKTMAEFIEWQAGKFRGVLKG